jgi:hypothetical protein
MIQAEEAFIEQPQVCQGKLHNNPACRYYLSQRNALSLIFIFT